MIIISVDSDGAYILKKEGTAVVKVAAEYEVSRLEVQVVLLL